MLDLELSARVIIVQKYLIIHDNHTCFGRAVCKNILQKMNRLKTRNYLQVYGILKGGQSWKYCT